MLVFGPGEAHKVSLARMNLFPALDTGIRPRIPQRNARSELTEAAGSWSGGRASDRESRNDANTAEDAADLRTAQDDDRAGAWRVGVDDG
ncbi:hypothetical protein BQ8482_380105 [Mesorhizobium delmotii]|uniref:Uncharacterized protein n=1 Tax=Mesorhizobium delmotii TaxID=1631247 RepID=A0A2P9ARY2_9HYPH|nr:hypothetical protein BQ8482_380105 [Mesorhizobium delmotii]